MSLQIENLTLHLDGFSLQDISFNLPTGKVAVILGPSGSGKSMLLDTLAGFCRPQSGRILLDGRDITSLPPEARQIGFMFQDYALFPNRTVRENILFSLRFRKKSKNTSNKESNLDVGQIMTMLRIDHLADRATTSLSGGEKQRVALARALISTPRIFLFDEPMSALDARAKEKLRLELGQLLHKLSLTAIYVTHDQAEASALGDLICIMENGRLAQTGTHEEVFRHPTSPFVAKFVGMENLLEGQVIDIRSELDGHTQVSVKTEGTDGTSEVLITCTDTKVTLGEKVLLGIRPEDLVIEPISPKRPVEMIEHNVICATITDVVPWGVVYRVRLEGPLSLIAFQTQHHIRKNGFAEGQLVQVTFPSASLHLIRQLCL